MNKTFSYTVNWNIKNPQYRMRFIQDKWNNLYKDAILIGFKPFLFEHSKISESSTLISVTAYKPLRFASLLYFLSHHRGFSFPLWWRWGMK